MAEPNWEELLSAQIDDCANLILAAYQAAEGEMLLPFLFQDSFTVADLAAYPLIEKTFNKVINSLTNIAVGDITASVKKSWDLSNRKNNDLVNKYFKGWQGAEADKLKELYQQDNFSVRNAFLERKTNGLNLSERVWNYNQGYKKEIEDALQIGISNGVSAKKMASLLKDYLNNPSATIMEVDEAGVASKLIGQDKTGRGIYKDPKKNALRLARTETNIAYRTADITRYNQLDFIVGYEVHLSKNHTSGHGMHVVDLHDICDELQGKYPKDFKFTGWHPNCRCYITTILKSPKEMEKDEERIRKGEPPSESSDSKNAVPSGKPPKQLRQWTSENKARLENSTSLPYFVRDNIRYFGKVDFSDAVKAQFAESAEMRRAATLQKAKIRQNSRTPQQIQDIKDRWAARQKEVHRQQILAKAAERHSLRTPEQIADIKARWAEHEKAVRRMQTLQRAAERHAARTPQQIADIKARWEQRRQNNITIAGGARYLDVAKGYKFDATLIKELEQAVGKRDAKKIEKAMADIRDAKNSIKGLQYIDLDDFRQFTADELQQASAAVKSKVQSFASLPLDKQKSKLTFEAQWVAQTQKFSTWQIAERAYKAELAEVEYKIRVEEYKANLANFKAYKSKSKAYNDAVKQADKMLSGARLTAAEEADLKTLFKDAEADFVKSHKHITAADFAKFTPAELDAADNAITTMLSNLSGKSLADQQTAYSKQIADLVKYKKYKTWELAKRVYEGELAKVEYQIRINEYTDRINAIKTFKTTDKTFASNLKKAEAILKKGDLTAADETALKKLLADLESQSGVADAYIKMLEDKYMQMIQAQNGKYSVSLGGSNWKPASKKLADLGHEYQKAVEEQGYKNYATAPPTPSIDNVTKAQVDKAKKAYLGAKSQYLPYVQDPVGGVFKGAQNYITGHGTWDAWSCCVDFAKKMQNYGVDVTPEELSLICRYTYKSGFINSYLLGGANPPPNAAQQKLLDAYKIALNSVLTKLPKYKGVSFRGGCLDRKKLAKGQDGLWNSLMSAWDNGGVWESVTPMSTTANVDTPDFFGSGITTKISPPDRQRILFIVKGKTGVSVSKIAVDPKQDEVLFRAGSKFKLAKKPYQITDKNAPFGDVGDYLVELEEI